MPNEFVARKGLIVTTGGMSFSGPLKPAGLGGTAGYVLTSLGPTYTPYWSSGATTSSNIYNSDGSLTANRTLTYNNKSLDFVGSGFFDNAHFENSWTSLSIGTPSNHAAIDISASTPNVYAQITIDSGISTSYYGELVGNSNFATGSVRWNLSAIGGTQYAELRVNNTGCSLYAGPNLAGLSGIDIDLNGRVGVNKPAPTEKLDVAGNIRFSGALMPNNVSGTAGQILTSDGIGSAPKWTSITPGAVVFGSTSSGIGEDPTKLFWTDTSNCLSVGTASATGSLHVVGNTIIDEGVLQIGVNWPGGTSIQLWCPNLPSYSNWFWLNRVNGAGMAFYCVDAAAYYFYMGADGAFRLGGSAYQYGHIIADTGGRVLIGNTDINGTPNAAAIFELRGTLGFLPTRLTSTQKFAISGPTAGLEVYDSTLNQKSIYNGVTWSSFQGNQGFQGVTGPGFTTISNAADNRVLTSLGTTNTANAEDAMTFDSTTSTLAVRGPIYEYSPTTIWGSQSILTRVGYNGLADENGLIYINGIGLGVDSLKAPIINIDLNSGDGTSYYYNAHSGTQSKGIINIEGNGAQFYDPTLNFDGNAAAIKASLTFSNSLGSAYGAYMNIGRSSQLSGAYQTVAYYGKIKNTSGVGYGLYVDSSSGTFSGTAWGVYVAAGKSYFNNDVHLDRCIADKTGATGPPGYILAATQGGVIWKSSVPSLTASYIGYGGPANTLIGGASLIFDTNSSLLLTGSAGIGIYLSDGNIGVDPNESGLYCASGDEVLAGFKLTGTSSVYRYANGVLHVSNNNNVLIGITAWDQGTGKLQVFGKITASDDVVSFGNASDINLKTNLVKIPHPLETILQLNGYQYDWKEESTEYKIGIKKDVSVIAQEVQKVLPDLVRTNADGYLSVRDKGLIAVLIEAVKELHLEVEELKSKLK